MSASKPLMVYGLCVWCQGNVRGHPEEELASQGLIRKIREADNTEKGTLGRREICKAFVKTCLIFGKFKMFTVVW